MPYKNPEDRKRQLKEWRKKNPDYSSEYSRKYRKENPKYEQDQRAKHRHKMNARAKVQYAVRVGKIVKEKCEVCGDVNTQGHHDDYSKPLVVRWLCVEHHMEVHSTMK